GCGSRVMSPSRTSRSAVLVTVVACTCSRDTTLDSGSRPVRLNASSRRTSNRAQLRPDGFSVAATRASRSCCARSTETTTAMPSAASVHPCARHCRFASASGSIGSGRGRATAPRYCVRTAAPVRRINRTVDSTIHPNHRRNTRRVDPRPAPPDDAGGMPVIEVTDLTKSYAGRTVLDGITFSVEEGEIFGILGPNGTGKTTTVEIIEGLRRADAGTVRVLGLDPVADARALHERIGVQLQHTQLP